MLRVSITLPFTITLFRDRRRPIQKGVNCLRANQRESGRWFVRSLNTDKFHYITNAGTSFAVLALKACE